MFGQRYAPDGTTVGGEFQINSYTTHCEGGQISDVDQAPQRQVRRSLGGSGASHPADPPSEEPPMSRSRWLARQSRLPQGLLGEVVALAMSYDTAQVNRAAIDRLDLHADDAVLEVGFGSGRALFQVAAKVREGFVAGVDPSEVMRRHARFRNDRYIRSGRMELQAGIAARLPYPDDRFDKAFAVHVLYFWPDPAVELAELARVLRPGGRLLLGFRPKDDPAVVAHSHPAIYDLRTLAEVEGLLKEAGFVDVRSETFTDRSRSMSWALGWRPE